MSLSCTISGILSPIYPHLQRSRDHEHTPSIMHRLVLIAYKIEVPIRFRNNYVSILYFCRHSDLVVESRNFSLHHVYVAPPLEFHQDL